MLSAIRDDWTLLLIPVFAGFIGWFTNWVAVKMMFYPIEFVGVRPIFGWQGIVPAHAVQFAGKTTELITTKLLSLKGLFASFRGDEFAVHLDAAIDQATDQVLEDMASQIPERWATIPDPVKAQVRQMLRAEIKQVNIAVLDDMGQAIEEILDLQSIVTGAAARDRRLISEMFQTVGRAELRFIVNSGAYFGFLFGIFQMMAWITWPTWWQLPAAGFMVGYVTNWLALKLVFRPRQAVKVGPFTVQGLFHKRQQEVSAEFARMVSGEVINPDNMVANMVTGAPGDKLFGIVEKHIGDMVDRYRTNPMVGALIPADRWDTIRGEAFARMREELPRAGGFLHVFTSKAIDVHKELLDRMTVLDSESFEGVLRPAFQQDEWKLIVAGGVLGLGAGVFQVVYLFGDYLT